MTVLTPTRKCRFWAEIGMALVWNRFEQVRIRILTFKFELKSHFIMIQNLKMLKYLQLRLLQNRSFRISFFQNNKIYQNSDFKNSKFSEISISKITKITILGFDSSANQVLLSWLKQALRIVSRVKPGWGSNMSKGEKW